MLDGPAAKPLKICLVSDEEIVGSAAIIPRGIGQYILRCGKMLAEQGHAVTIACASAGSFDTMQDGVRTVGVARGALPWDISIYTWLLRNRFDIVEFPEWQGYGFLPAMLLPAAFGKVVTRGHGHSLRIQRAHGLDVRKRRQHYKEWLQIRFSRGVLANSHFLKSEFVTDFGISASRVDICPIGVDAQALGGVRPTSRTYAGPTLVYVGALDRCKGAVTLLHILDQMNRQQGKREAKLIMVGQDTLTGPDGGSYREYCLETARRLGILDQVELLPTTPRAQLYGIYERASVFVSASRAETLGIPFLEAMSLGLPVVTWRTGAAPELITHGRDGLLYDWNDRAGFAAGVLSILHDRSVWNAYSENALDNVRTRFLEKDVMDKQVSWYRAALNPKMSKRKVVYDAQ